MKQITLTAGEIAEMVKGTIVGNPDRVVKSVAGIRVSRQGADPAPAGAGAPQRTV